MYIAALRIADDFGCDTIGIQYQQGLKDLLPASDLVEGTLNNADRPPVAQPRRQPRCCSTAEPLPHFNEVDECAGLDAPDDLPRAQARWASRSKTRCTICAGAIGTARGTVTDYVWVLLISGSAPPAHFIGGWQRRRRSDRQPAMYFRLGGGTLKGISKPGEIVWSRIFVDDGRLKMDLGRAGVVELPSEETERRWQATTPQWPIMHAVTYGVSRDQMMARHKANHIQVAYANSAEGGRRGPVGQGRDGRRHGHAKSRSAARAKTARSGNLAAKRRQSFACRTNFPVRPVFRDELESSSYGPACHLHSFRVERPHERPRNVPEGPSATFDPRAPASPKPRSTRRFPTC